MTVRCPKCGSNAHSFLVRHPFIYGKTETEVRCHICGARRYGAEAERLVEQALAHRAAALEAERAARERAEAERRARLSAALEAERAREREAAERAREEAAEQERRERLAAELAEEKGVVDGMVARRLEQTAAARQAWGVASRLRRERLGAAHDAAVAERGEDAVCASPLCANPRPPGRRYCGKGCSDHVARERYAARRRAAP